jgi:hypothetical protein
MDIRRAGSSKTAESIGRPNALQGEWLEAGDGVFHVSGKPGAGKSTLMKFIFRNPRTKDLLTRWAAGRKLVFGKFFFWKPGSDMENSILAMRRSPDVDLRYSQAVSGAYRSYLSTALVAGSLSSLAGISEASF